MADDDKQLRDSIERVLKASKNPDAARKALAFLFPKAEQILKTYVPAGTFDISERRKSRRLSVRDFAPSYFQLEPSPTTWGRGEIESLLNDPVPSHAFDTVEQKLEFVPASSRPALRRLFLEELERAFSGARPFTLEWLRAILDYSKSYILARDETARFLFTVDNAHRLWRILAKGFESVNLEARSSLIKQVIPTAPDITALCEFFRAVAGDKHPEGSKDGRIESAGFGDDTEAIRKALVDRIRQLATSGELWFQAEPAKLLWFWWGCDLAQEVRDFTNRAMNNPLQLPSLLLASITQVHSSEGNYEVVSHQYSFIMDLAKAKVMAEQLLNSNGPDDEMVIARRFLTAFANQSRH